MSPDSRAAEAQALQHRVPLWAARVLHVDCGPGLLGAAARARSGAEVVGVFVGDDPDERVAAAAALARVYDTLHDAIAEETPLDCIVFSSAPSPEDWERLLPGLSDDGCVVCARRWLTPERALPAPLERYALWPWEYPQVELQEDFLPAPAEPHVEVIVRQGFDPMACAQRLAGARKFDRAYEVLSAIPPARREEAEFDARIQVMKMVCLLGLCKVGAYPALTCLAGALYLFARVQRRMPNQPATLILLGRFWDAVAMPEVGERLRTLAAELAGSSAQTSTLQVPTHHVDLQPVELGVMPHRALFIMGSDRVDYGLDVLYHGLKQVLGEAGVDEFPYKATLHGAPAAEFAHYPAQFQHEGTPRGAEEILTLLHAGHYDVVVWGDADMALPRDLAQAIAAAARPLRLALVDMRDDCDDHSLELCAWLGLSAPAPYFKRELLRGAHYGVSAHALPFAYADDLVARQIDAPRMQAVFWAGQRGWGLRDVFLPVLEGHGVETHGHYTQEEYRARLGATRACVSLAGAGFDTVRYWEVPAQGALLLSERLPLRIPHDFTDMEDALFFATRRDLAERLAYIEAHPEQVDAMRLRGWEKLRQHHTASARARQFLAGFR